MSVVTNAWPSGVTLGGTPRQLFERFADGVPTSYLMALAWHESRFNPNAISPTGAEGLFQITLGVIRDFNRSTGRTYTEPDMYDPAKCAEVSVWHLNQIQDAYDATDPEKFRMPYTQAWNDRDYVALVTLGYTAGWSPTQGVAHLVRKMLDSGIAPHQITLDSVIAEAKRRYPSATIYVDPQLADADGRGPYMSHPFLKTHVNRVVTDYFDTAQYWRTKSGGGAVTKKGGGYGWLLAALGVGGALYAARKRGQA